MPEANPIEKLQRRLIELGCPVKAVRKIVRETAEHFQDLRGEAMRQGLPQSAAEAQATALLGNPEALAEEHVRVWRNSQVWLRHPWLGWGLVHGVLGSMAFFTLVILGKMEVQYDNMVSRSAPGELTGKFFLEGILLYLIVRYCLRIAGRYVLRFRWVIAALPLSFLYGVIMTDHLSYYAGSGSSYGVYGEGTRTDWMIFQVIDHGPAVGIVALVFIVAAYGFHTWDRRRLSRMPLAASTAAGKLMS